MWYRTTIGVIGIVLGMYPTPVVSDMPRKQRTSADVVKMNVMANKPDEHGRQAIIITLTIAPSWSIIANSAGADDSLALVMTKIRIEPQAKVQECEVEYPEGKLVKTDYDFEYRIYEGKVTFKATVLRKVGDRSDLEVVTSVSAFNRQVVLLSSALKGTVSCPRR